MGLPGPPTGLARRQHLSGRFRQLLRHGRAARRPDQARHYPMPLPVFVSSEAEREQLLQINPVTRIRAIAEKAALRLVGVGQIDQGAQLFVDGFISREELLELMRLGAVGELTGWAFDAQGHIIDGGTNRRLTSVPHRAAADVLTVGLLLSGRPRSPPSAPHWRGAC